MERNQARQQERTSAFSGDHLRRWWDVIYLAAKDLFTDSGPAWAAAIAYYSLLSVPPLLLAAISIASFFVDTEWAIEQITGQLEEFVPEGVEEIDEVIREALAAGGGVGLISLGVLLWTGTRIFGAVTQALNVAYDVDETYGFLKRTLVELVMLATIGVLFVIALMAQPLLNLLSNILDILPAGGGTAFRVIQFVVPPLLLFFVLTAIYQYVPRGKHRWRASLLGAAVATLLFVLARPLFIGYVQEFGDYNVIYGSLAVVILLTFWAWIIALIVLFGGEFASHYRAIILDGLSPAEVERRHQRRSPAKKDETD